MPTPIRQELNLPRGVNQSSQRLKLCQHTWCRFRVKSARQIRIIIANNLRQEQEDKLLNVLRQHKKAIGWKLSNLPGINPSICMHRILMEEEIKPIRQQQRRLNPKILDVVKKEVTKLLVAWIIYPISDSQWVSPMQVVPKKSKMTVTKNQQDELVPVRIQNS
ncbi:hypothetical protein CR513_14277, partial [Mucuna pruriens]